jgi:hypothetical protein
MTRARALKTVIRARAAKTGERYTTARRHVLKALEKRSAPRPVASVAATSPSPAPVLSTKGSISDAKCREKTGHDLAYWFDVLDRFGAVATGHAAAARHLHESHGVDGWYSQGITVAYERVRGLRAVNQRRSGTFEVSVSKVVRARTDAIVAAFVEPRRRRRWAGADQAGVIAALAAGLRDPRSKGFVVKPNGQARCRYKWNETTVEVYVEPKPGDRCSVVVRHLALPSSAAVDERRGAWRAALAALGLFLATRPTPRRHSGDAGLR